MRTAVIILLASLVLGTACGTSRESESETTPVPTGGAQATAAPFDPDTPLVDYQSADKGYTVSYPEGWRIVGGPEEFTDGFLYEDASRTLAQLTVSCQNPEDHTLESLMGQDIAVASRFSGGPTDEPTPVEIAGGEGIRFGYSLVVAGLRIEQLAAYVIEGDCAWRIGFSAYGEGTLEPYLPLFDRILSTFQPG